MKFPNKIIRYNESILSKFPLVLQVLESGDLSIVELFDATNDRLPDVTDFMDIIVCLYALGKINYDEKSRRLSYVA